MNVVRIRGLFSVGNRIPLLQYGETNFVLYALCQQKASAPTTSDVTVQGNIDHSSRQFETKSPYKGMDRQLRDQFKKKQWDGGLLPRPDEMKDIPVRGMPEYDPDKKDQWTREKALFGQNDYIDILGDGTVHPADTIEGPQWAQRFKGNEFRRILRQFQFEDEYLREMEPEKYHSMEKQARYLHKLGQKRTAQRGQKNNPKRKSRTDRFNSSKNFLY